MVEVTRRTVLAAGGLAAAATCVRAAPAGAAGLAGRAAFESVLGRQVMLRTPAGRVAAVVTEVGDLLGAPAGAADRWTVLLRPQRQVPDGIYQVSGAGLHAVGLFFANVDRRSAAALQAVVDTHTP